MGCRGRIFSAPAAGGLNGIGPRIHSAPAAGGPNRTAPPNPTGTDPTVSKSWNQRPDNGHIRVTRTLLTAVTGVVQPVTNLVRDVPEGIPAGSEPKRADRAVVSAVTRTISPVRELPLADSGAQSGRTSAVNRCSCHELQCHGRALPALGRATLWSRRSHR